MLSVFSQINTVLLLEVEISHVIMDNIYSTQTAVMKASLYV